MTSARTASRRVRPRGLTVQRWFLLTFTLIALLVIAAAALIGRTLLQTRDISDQLTSSILPAEAQAYRLQAALRDEETGIHGYGITGDPLFLQPYLTGYMTERASVARLRALIGSLPRLAADVNNIEHAVGEWRVRYATPIRNHSATGPLGSQYVALLRGSLTAFDGLRRLFATQLTHLSAAAAHDQARLDTARSSTNWLYTGILIAFLLAAGGLAFALHGAVVRPLDQLREASRQVAGGDFDQTIPLVGPADMRAVAADVEAMRRELTTALDDARVAERIAARQATDLDQYAAELRRSNAELEQFAYVASHDLQEPLRKIASFCQLLAQRYDDLLDDRGRQYIAFAVDGAKRMQALINDLLELSRVGRAGPLEQLSLGQTLDAAISSLGTVIERTGALVERPESLPPVLGDATLLEVVWQNLLGNALKFIEPGRTPVVRVSADQPANEKWQFCVADNGIGVPPEFAGKVFIIFQRLHRREAFSGTGIGLALCKRIIQHHGGDIWIDTGYSGGTRICFTLPAVRPEDPSSRSGGISAEGISA